PSGLAEVLEVPEAGLFRRDKQDVVVVVRSKKVNRPVHPSAGAASNAAFNRPRNNLVERRIARQPVGQFARGFGMRAADLNRGWGAAALVVVRVDVDATRRVERESNSWIEPLIHAVAVERTGAAAGIDLVTVADGRAVVPSRCGEVH